MHELTELQHCQMLYPAVRVRAQKAGGSGTIIYSKPDKTGEFHSFALTNHHVIEDCVQVKKKWDSKLGRELKKETRATVYTEIFQYKYLSHCIGNTALESDIMCYDADQDIALLKLRSIEKMEHVANFIKKDDIPSLKIFDPTFAIGASLGHPPIATQGMITYMDDEIDNYKYWMSNAQIIYGNSGGSMYVRINDVYYFIGIPSRVSISGWADTITHMGYFIPPINIMEFLDKNHYEFIYDSNKTMEDCDAERKKEEELARKAMEKELGVVS